MDDFNVDVTIAWHHS